MTSFSYCVAVDCYPRSGGVFFAKVAGAVATCWICSEVPLDAWELDLLVERHLLLEGWRVGRGLSARGVSSR